MCKSIAEGGLRCASHTRPAYVAALAAARTGPLEAASQLALAEAAQAYAATPTGFKAAARDVETLRTEDKVVAAAVIDEAMSRGRADYLNAKEATRLIEQEQLRAEVTNWARAVPVHPAALEEYKSLLARDLGLDDDGLELALAAQRFASAHDPAPLDPGDIAAARYVTVHDGQYVGTGTDPNTLRMIADLERLAADARRAKRAGLEHVDTDGRRWVRYENDHLSEVLRAVHYDPDTHDLNVVLKADENSPDAGPTYTYKDVHPSMFEALICARSMGRLYSYTFSRLHNHGSLGNAGADDFSFAIAAANAMTPIGSSTGPVPVKVPRRLAGVAVAL